MQRSPNRWSCMPTAFAMALDVPYQTLLQEIGHDGSEIIFPECPEPICRRAFHIQEFIDPCMKRGYALMIIEACPMLAARHEGEELIHPISSKMRLFHFLANYKGVIICSIRNLMHAVAWDQNQCYDPSGPVFGLRNLEIREFFPLIKIQS